MEYGRGRGRGRDEARYGRGRDDGRYGRGRDAGRYGRDRPRGRFPDEGRPYERRAVRQPDGPWWASAQTPTYQRKARRRPVQNRPASVNRDGSLFATIAGDGEADEQEEDQFVRPWSKKKSRAEELEDGWLTTKPTPQRAERAEEASKVLAAAPQSSRFAALRSLADKAEEEEQLSKKAAMGIGAAIGAAAAFGTRLPKMRNEGELAESPASQATAEVGEEQDPEVTAAPRQQAVPERHSSERRAVSEREAQEEEPELPPAPHPPRAQAVLQRRVMQFPAASESEQQEQREEPVVPPPPPPPPPRPQSSPVQEISKPEEAQTPPAAPLDETVRTLSGARFDDLPISYDTKMAIRTELEHEYMTDIQAQALPPILNGSDVIARARTGTGKTLAFTIPIVEKLVQQPGRGCAVIVEPTRELVAQAADVARQLLDAHGSGFEVLSLVGTAKFIDEQAMLHDHLPDVIVATPGRLKDHILFTNGVKESLEGRLQVLVLDEADRLLGGFKNIVMDILENLPPPDQRQGLMFSATFPSDVSELAWFSLRPDFKHIDTIKEGEHVTPSQVTQLHATVKLEDMADVLWRCLENIFAKDLSARVMVFFTTARVTQYYAELFRAAGMDVEEMHSRRAANKRTASAHRFWTQGGRAVLFTTDVSARGLDYPDVTNVIHFGAASSRDRYIHRLGRSGRMGAIGQSLLLLQDFEENFLEKINDLPLTLTGVEELTAGVAPAPEALRHPHSVQRAHQAYRAWMGYYKVFSRDLGWDLEGIVAQAYRFASSIGCLTEDGKAPPIKMAQIKKLRLVNVAGINVREEVSGRGEGDGEEGSPSSLDDETSPETSADFSDDDVSSSVTDRGLGSEDSIDIGDTARTLTEVDAVASDMARG
eukprot:TRINITY_DN80045_c0_g1_i1.p1 TRINITY_DN80045_c0_g1~~TRINITY_DN80045_c0_g1_i1.p1  ORF type:complete len:1012 (-),score=152.62 TRINITY_DN80045_c0_g1_i1:8-2650(-)